MSRSEIICLPVAVAAAQWGDALQSSLRYPAGRSHRRILPIPRSAAAPQRGRQTMPRTHHLCHDPEPPAAWLWLPPTCWSVSSANRSTVAGGREATAALGTVADGPRTTPRLPFVTHSGSGRERLPIRSSIQSHSLGSFESNYICMAAEPVQCRLAAIFSRRRGRLFIPERAHAHAAFNLVSLKSR
jgi:hypothetical protein